jgi:hypothetical protein
MARSESTDRINDVAGILAEGLQRLLARQSSDKAADGGEISLQVSPDQSGRPISIEEVPTDGG